MAKRSHSDAASGGSDAANPPGVSIRDRDRGRDGRYRPRRDTVTTERLVAKEVLLTDSAGRGRIVMAVKGDVPRIEIFDESGKRRVHIVGFGGMADGYGGERHLMPGGGMVMVEGDGGAQAGVEVRRGRSSVRRWDDERYAEQDAKAAAS